VVVIEGVTSIFAAERLPEYVEVGEGLSREGQEGRGLSFPIAPISFFPLHPFFIIITCL